MPRYSEERKVAFLHGTGLQEWQEKAVQEQQRDARKTIKKLQAEVRLKDSVLTGITSLLVLSKKLETLYAEDPKARTANTADLT